MGFSIPSYFLAKLVYIIRYNIYTHQVRAWSLSRWPSPSESLSLSIPPAPRPVQPPDLVLSDRHSVHRDGSPGGLGAPWGGLREQPRQVGLSTLQCPVKVCAANVHLDKGVRGQSRRPLSGSEVNYSSKPKASDSAQGRRSGVRGQNSGQVQGPGL